jgi:tetratricopeptide (TPR) repeat protein
VIGIYGGYLLALASKEIAITLPALLLLLELWPRVGSTEGRPGWRAVVALHAPLYLGVVALLTVLFPERIAAGALDSPWAYLLTQAKVIWLYLGMVVAPWLLAAAYDVGVSWSLTEPAVLAGGLGILALLALAAASFRRAPLVGLAVLWTLICLSPTSSFVPGPLLVDEDRAYLPLILLWGLCGAGLVRLWFAGGARRLAAGVVALGLLAGTSLLTVERCVTWSRPLWLWTDALRKYPGAPMARAELCVLLSKQPGRLGQAVASCREVLRTQRGGYQDLGRAGLATALMGLGRADEAAPLVREGLRRAPDDPALRRIAGHLAWARGDLERAAAHYRRVLARDRDEPQATLYLARIHLQRGDRRRAAMLVRRAAGLPIPDTGTRLLLAELLLDLGQTAGARRILRALHEQAPGRAEPLIGLARLEAAAGRTRAALAHLEAAHRRAGDNEAVLLRIAGLQLRLGQGGRARGILERILARNPDAGLARATLARIHLRAGRLAQACRHLARLRRTASAGLWGDLARACAGRSPCRSPRFPGRMVPTNGAHRQHPRRGGRALHAGVPRDPPQAPQARGDRRRRGRRRMPPAGGQRV